jgi:myo-inositol 2-dehydrogenase / D-chiro-inositol 1-dehydrogenase
MYADGMLTNWGAHLVDICQWANGTERTGPIEVQATGRYHADPVWDVLETFEARYRFANGVEMFYTMDQPQIRFEGDKGWLQVHYSKSVAHPEWLEASDPGILAATIPADGVRFPLRSERVDFIEAVKTRRPTMEDAEIGQRTISICHLAHIGVKRNGVALAWDPETERFPKDTEANTHLSGPAGRAPWGTE